MNEEALYLTKVESHAADARTVFGFWTYLTTDCVLFAALFSVYAVLHVGGGVNLFSLPFVLVETLLLLTSSFTCGLALLAARDSQKAAVMQWLGVTFVLGAAFLALEISEFSRLVASGHGPQLNGSFSSYFTLVGTHGLHVFVGLLWMLALLIALSRRGLSRFNLRKLVLLAFFWHFLDIIWIFIFTFVYLTGSL
ncbi:MAG TPA: cytochrome c oxidase subunit 3 [Candidatus Paceibacterota bacterium]|nr:cytochrome c oxidase subunit 3 [Candidatus Paceibacterota bacterium]